MELPTVAAAEANPAKVGPPLSAGFKVRLENFSGPFDLLLGLISKHELDVTDIALARVTDEFIAYIKGAGESEPGWALDEASEFLVVAATLLDLKAARLLPSGQVEDDKDIALLEARDLLFARLLQYKAFKHVAANLEERLGQESARFPREVPLETQFTTLLPRLAWKADANVLAALATKTLEAREPEATAVGLDHLHGSSVTVREEAAFLRTLLVGGRPHSFLELTADAEEILVVVARFLALLEMFRDEVVSFDQLFPLGELTVRWIAHDDAWDGSSLSGEFDDTPTPSEDE
ncbi:segregation and condensation protein A [Arthrobacter roseus]|uniref:segregation and condensation protein A n=1 Tax=Arthrobacter roseus TaxID=136274 RepID=UPI001962A1E4|nr:segregation/condensation protein A [Arthrobacter roseus]MBM7848294.1 segregation and condensation protein A [Arthrobacter roseus]